MRLSRPLALTIALLASALLIPAGAQATKTKKAPNAAKVPVPAVAGKRDRAATKALRAAGLKVTITRTTSATVRKGRAIATTPAAGAKVRRGVTVKLLVSSGRPNTVTYQGSGAIDDVDPAAGTLDVAFADAAGPLAALLAGRDDGDDAVLGVLVDDHTKVTVTRTDGAPSGNDLSFACVGDHADVTVVAPGPVKQLDDVAAAKVVIASSDDSTCVDDPSQDDEDDASDDPADDPGEDPGDERR